MFSARMDDPIIMTRELSRRFGPITAVADLTLSVQPREIFGLLGPNGAGKTTVIKILTTLLPPSSGEARICGCDVCRDAVAVRRSIGYVPQAISVDGALSGYENLLIFAKLFAVPRAERERRVWQALAFIGLADSAHRLVRDYSGGMIRRLEVAQSTLHRPRVLFLDEPTIGLDPIARRLVWRHLEQLRTDHATTIFFTTHDLAEAEAHCDRVAIMQRGRLKALGTCAELEASLGRKGSSLEDVFIREAGNTDETDGNFRATSQERATARRLG